MKRLAFLSLALVSSAAYGQTCDTPICDPASFHVSGPGATGTDPVILTDTTEFTVTNISAGQDIPSPLTIFFATTDGPPTVDGYSFDGGIELLAPAVVSDGSWDFTAPGIAQDLYTALGCPNGGCDKSLNVTNIDDAYVSVLGQSAPTKLNLYSITLDVSFPAKDDFVTVFGSFGNGTIIAPLAADFGLQHETFWDTSWTNAGFVDGSIIPPPPPPPPAIPEPRTWLMLALGLLAIVLLDPRRPHAPVA